MAKDTKIVRDPVDDIIESRGDEELDALDPKHVNAPSDGGLTMDEVGAIQQRKTAAPHPFEGYRIGRKVQVGPPDRHTGAYVMIPSTYLILLKPSDEPTPDPSNEKLTIHTSKAKGKGGDPKLSDYVRTVTLGTYHTRMVTDRSGGQNHQVVFDREVEIQGQRVFCAIVPSHAQRSQVCFKFDQKHNKVLVDKRYMLADMNQSQPLLRMFRAINWQQTESERKAKDFDSTPESTAADRELE